MTLPLTPIITTAGLQALFNANNNGLQATLTHLALGSVGWNLSADATQLNQEQQRVPLDKGTRIQASQIHLTAIENGNSDYWVREIGFLLADGTLFALWSHPSQALAWKASQVDLLLAFDLILSALPNDSVTFHSTGRLNLAPATTAQTGLVRLLTSQEALNGQSTQPIAMQPADTRAHGDARYAQQSHPHRWDDIHHKPTSYPPDPHNHDDRYPLIAGDYASLCARANTQADVGLANVPNFSASSSVSENNPHQFATSAAVKQAYDRAHSRSLGWGSVQLSEYMNHLDAPMDYTVPHQHVIVGLYSHHSNHHEDHRWRVRYRHLSLL